MVRLCLRVCHDVTNYSKEDPVSLVERFSSLYFLLIPILSYHLVLRCPVDCYCCMPEPIGRPAQ